MNAKFFFSNILKTTCNNVRERVKNALFLHMVTLSLQNIKKTKKNKKNFTFINSSQYNNLRLLTKNCTHLLKTSNLGQQGLQNEALQQRFSPC